MESQGLSTLSSPDWPVLWMSPPLHIKTEFEICRKHPDFKIIQVGSFGERIDRSGGAKTVCWTQERVFNPQTECDFIISSHSHKFPYIPITHFNPFSLHFKIAKSFHRFPCRLGSVFWSNQNGDTKLRRLCDVSPITKSDDFKTFLWESFKLWEKQNTKILQNTEVKETRHRRFSRGHGVTVSRLRLDPLDPFSSLHRLGRIASIRWEFVCWSRKSYRGAEVSMEDMEVCKVLQTASHFKSFIFCPSWTWKFCGVIRSYTVACSRIWAAIKTPVDWVMLDYIGN